MTKGRRERQPRNPAQPDPDCLAHVVCSARDGPVPGSRRNTPAFADRRYRPVLRRCRSVPRPAEGRYRPEGVCGVLPTRSSGMRMRRLCRAGGRRQEGRRGQETAEQHERGIVFLHFSTVIVVVLHHTTGVMAGAVCLIGYGNAQQLNIGRKYDPVEAGLPMATRPASARYSERDLVSPET